MSKQQSPVKEAACYVQAERAYIGGGHSEYRYSIYINGDFVVCDASADDMRNLSAAIQQALTETAEKGGE